MEEEYSFYKFQCPAYAGRSLVNQEDDEIMRFLLTNRPYASTVYSWDDVGLGELMIDTHKDAYRYCVNTKTWFVWQGHRWLAVPHENYMINTVAQFTSLMLIYAKEAAHLAPDDAEIIDEYEKYLHRMRTHKKITDIVRYLSTDVDISASGLDWNPQVLKTTGNAIDLTTGSIITDEKPLMITLQAGTHPLREYDVPTTRWYTFIDEIMSHDMEKARFLQRALGYSLLGTNQEECMFIAYGPKSRNGKGTLFSAIGAALGDYMRTCSAKFICVKPNEREVSFDSPQPFLADLPGVRIVSMSEADESEMLSAASVKSLTGRDEVTTRQLYGRPYSYLPQFTLWLSTNYLPNVSDNTIFMSNRIWVIRFDETFIGKPDTGLKDLFMSEDARPTILSWLMEGCLEYQRIGLCPPKSVTDATESYKKTSDIVGKFLIQCCEYNPDSQVEKGELYDAFRMWCGKRENRMRPFGTQRFYKLVEQHNLYFVNEKLLEICKGVKLKSLDKWG